MLRKGETLYSANPAEADALSKLPQNCDLNVTITKARSIRQNNTYWGLLKWVIENGPEWIGNNWKTPQAFSDVLQIELGYTRIVARFNGEEMAFPESKNFEEMPQDRFNKYFSEVQEILNEFCGYDPLVVYLNRKRNAA